MLVAVEFGGEWRATMRPDSGVDLVMVTQVDGEDPLLFARRFLRKVITIVAQGADVVSAVLVVAATFDLRHLEARCAIARTVLRSFRRETRRELYLVEPRNAKPDCLAHLLAIAEGLTDNASSDCRIRVGYATLSQDEASNVQPAMTSGA